MAQDITAARVVLDCGVPLVQIPCTGVTSHLLTTMPELETHLKGKNAVSDALVELFKEYHADHFGWAKEIWDISAIAYVINPNLVPTSLVHAPIISDQLTWGLNNDRHFIRTAVSIDRNSIFKDMFTKLAHVK